MRLSGKAFTLLEILIVLVIIGVLATLAYGHLVVIREKASVRIAENKLQILLAADKAYNIDTGLWILAGAGFSLNNSLLSYYLGGENYDTDPDWRYMITVMPGLPLRYRFRAVKQANPFIAETLDIIYDPAAHTEVTGGTHPLRTQ